MNYRLTTLVENEAPEGSSLINEHGLSVFIESPAGNILFDTGETGAFLKNAKTLGIPIETISNVIISHGHHDHSNGLMSLIDDGVDAFTLNVSQFFYREKFRNVPGDQSFTGHDYHLEDIAAKNIKIDLIKEDVTEVIPNIFLVTNFERNFTAETTHPRFVYKENGKTVLDPFDDEVALVIKSADGLVLIFGCSHPGVVNMINSVKKHFDEPIKTLIGGTHLKIADRKRIDDTIEILKNIGVDKIGVSHCTGKEATQRIKEEFGDAFFKNITGSVIEFD